jgi:hypothetical protein
MQKLVLLFFFGSCFSHISAQMKPHSLAFDTSFNKLALEILGQDKIYQMDDCSRYFKRVNQARIYLGKQPSREDTLLCTETLNCPRPLYLVLDSFAIDLKVFNDFRNRLHSTKLREFQKFKDKLLFTVDGFLDHTWGYVFSTDGSLKLNEKWVVDNRIVRVVEVVNGCWAKVSVY